MEILAVGAQHAVAHSALADKMPHRHTRQAQSPAGQQREGCVLAQASDSRRCVEKDHRLLSRGVRCVRGDLSSPAGALASDFAIPKFCVNRFDFAMLYLVRFVTISSCCLPPSVGWQNRPPIGAGWRSESPHPGAGDRARFPGSSCHDNRPTHGRSGSNRSTPSPICNPSPSRPAPSDRCRCPIYGSRQAYLLVEVHMRPVAVKLVMR